MERRERYARGSIIRAWDFHSLAVPASLAIADALIASDALAATDAQALRGYRAASHWIGADSWDGCPDCMEVLRLASGADLGREMDADTLAAALKELRAYGPVPALTPTAGTGEGWQDHQLATALYDSENSARLQEHPEELDAYLKRARQLQHHMRVLGIGVAALAASPPEVNRLDAVERLTPSIEDVEAGR
jgi:hypothetical protein